VRRRPGGLDDRKPPEKLQELPDFVLVVLGMVRGLQPFRVLRMVGVRDAAGRTSALAQVSFRAFWVFWIERDFGSLWMVGLWMVGALLQRPRRMVGAGFPGQRELWMVRMVWDACGKGPGPGLENDAREDRRLAVQGGAMTAKVEFVKGDITEQEVDCIVNAANETLLGGGGVDGAIHRKAGPRLLRECQAIRQVEPGVRCPAGEARITCGCGLPAKYVIHTVAPRYYGPAKQEWTLTKRIYQGHEPRRESTVGSPSADKGKKMEALAACYRNCLLLADKHAQGSVAFCSLGTGGFAWPVAEASPIAVKAVLATLPEVPGIRLVRFVLFSDSDLKDYKAEYERQVSA
jgi:O-acetyl-ADP-ribose deacetylase (regulator of RNase III)